MKILQINKMYSPDIGGVETVCQQYSEFYAKNHEVTVLCVNKNFSFFGSTSIVNGVKVIRCGSLGTYFSMPVSLSFIFVFMLEYFKCNIVFIHLPFPLADLALFLSSFIKRKAYLVWHSDIVKQSTLRTVLMPMLNHTIKFADRVIVTSPKMLEFSFFLQKYPHKCTVIPLSIDAEKIRASSASCINPFQGEDEFINSIHIDGLFLGRLCYYKGVDVLLDMLLLAKHAGLSPKIVIAGAGEYSKAVRDFILKNDLKNVFFIDRFVTDDEKYFLIKKAKCFLFPSIEVSEAFGITQLEAMCLGVPVINTNLSSGVPWVSLDGITGITVIPKEPKHLLNAFSELLSDEKKRNILGVNAVDRVDSIFDNSVLYRSLDSLLKQNSSKD